MSDVKIVPVPRPKSFGDVAFTQAEWDAAVKAGAKVMSPGAAREAVVNSKGLYQVKPLVEEIDPAVIRLPDPTEMTNEQLAAESAAYGQPIKKQMSRKVLIDFIRGQREKAVAFITDDDE